MARTIAVIAQTMIDAKTAESNLNGLTSTSQTSTWRLWIFIVATAINILEQFQDVFRTEMEALSSALKPGTPQWVQDRTFKFQYDATTPQVVTIVDATIVYPVENDALKIVTRCSVNTGANKVVNIKVAKNTSPTNTAPIALSAPEASALLSYWGLIGFAGITYNIINKDADKIGIVADIYYNGQYSSTIQADTILALNNYLASIPFDGNVSVLGIEDALQNVLGISDFKLNTLSGRADVTPFASRVKFYDLATSVNLRKYQTNAGYCVEETTAGQDFATTLTFIAV
jgi:hypothetical protein